MRNFLKEILLKPITKGGTLQKQGVPHSRTCGGDLSSNSSDGRILGMVSSGLRDRETVHPTAALSCEGGMKYPSRKGTSLRPERHRPHRRMSEVYLDGSRRMLGFSQGSSEVQHVSLLSGIGGGKNSWSNPVPSLKRDRMRLGYWGGARLS